MSSTSVQRGVRLAHTATKVPVEARGEVLVCGSHGGVYAGWLVARAGVRAAILHDAGVGLDAAGIGALAHFEPMGFALATVDYRSARIGDAQHMLDAGVVSHCNQQARAAGLGSGMTCVEAASLLTAAPPLAAPPGDIVEARHVVSVADGPVVCVDSVSLVRDEDADAIVMSGSHGGIVSGQRHLAIRVPARLAVYNDAGGGAGCARLEVLDEQDIAGATVAAHSARIGDGRSTCMNGVLSVTNRAAMRAGLAPGMSALEAVATMRAAS